jgi:hypothetical protein
MRSNFQIGLFQFHPRDTSGTKTVVEKMSPQVANVCSGITNRNFWLQREGDLVQRLAQNHQRKYPSTRGISYSIGQAA